MRTCAKAAVNRQNNKSCYFFKSQTVKNYRTVLISMFSQRQKKEKWKWRNNLTDVASVSGSSVVRHHVSFGDFVLHFKVLLKILVTNGALKCLTRVKIYNTQHLTSPPASVLAPACLARPLPTPSPLLRPPVRHLCPGGVGHQLLYIERSILVQKQIFEIWEMTPKSLL